MWDSPDSNEHSNSGQEVQCGIRKFCHIHDGIPPHPSGWSLQDIGNYSCLRSEHSIVVFYINCLFPTVQPLHIIIVIVTVQFPLKSYRPISYNSGMIQNFRKCSSSMQPIFYKHVLWVLTKYTAFISQLGSPNTYEAYI